MVKQDDPYLNPLAKWGCYFVSLANLAEKMTGIQRPAEAILPLWVNALKAGWVDRESTILDPEKVARSLGANVTFLGKKSADYMTKPGEFEILKFVKTGHEHFVLGDGTGKCLVDPMTAHSMEPYKLESKRIFKAV